MGWTALGGTGVPECRSSPLVLLRHEIGGLASVAERVNDFETPEARI